MFLLTDRQYGEGFQVSEFKGKISLIAAREDQAGKIWQRWGEIEIGKNKTAKLPVAVPLGEPNEAIKVLQAAIEAIRAKLHDGSERQTSGSRSGMPPVADNKDDDVPF